MERVSAVELARLSPADRFHRLGYGWILWVVIAAVAAIGANYLLSKTPNDAKELDRLRQENSQMSEQLKSLQRQIQSMRSESKENKTGSLESTPHLRLVNSTMDAQVTATPLSKQHLVHDLVLAQTNSPIVNAAAIVWLVIIGLMIVYIIAVVAVFMSTTAGTIEFAKDLIKTLTGFFSGIVIGLLGIHS